MYAKLTECLNCGKKNAKKSRFCYSCGNPLEIGNETKSPPTVKVVTPLDLTPPSYISNTSIMTTPSQITRHHQPGMCYYHQDLQAIYVCGRCGKTICQNCTKPYGQISLCPQCYGMPYQ